MQRRKKKKSSKINLGGLLYYIDIIFLILIWLKLIENLVCHIFKLHCKFLAEILKHCKKVHNGNADTALMIVVCICCYSIITILDCLQKVVQYRMNKVYFRYNFISTITFSLTMRCKVYAVYFCKLLLKAKRVLNIITNMFDRFFFLLNSFS